jgi:hypothetical protein
MNYIESVTDFFKSPKWMMNMLFAGICCFIPIVGPMVVLGWLITGFWCRPNGTPESFPEFDFSNFVKWLERGLWPMLTALVTSFALYFVFMIPMIIVMTVLGAGAGNNHNSGGGLMAALMALVMLGMELLMILAMVFLMKPIMLKATLTQDFAKAFDFAFIKRFVSLTWIELIVSTLFLGVVSFALMLCGMIAFCVGILLVPGVIYFAMAHMDRQLYNLYLSRGGEPIELSPKLNDTPPGLPGL